MFSRTIPGRIRSVVGGVLVGAALCAGTAGQASAQPAHPEVTLQTSLGNITVELYPERAPATVANFLAYVKSGFYRQTVFHRVIPGFMIQGGGYTAEFREKATRPSIPNEADNGLANVTGAIAMARTSDPNSAASQFFINVADNHFLDFRSRTIQGYGYAVFGRVVRGMDVVNRIAAQPTHGAGPFPSDVPVNTVIIRDAKQIGAVPAN